MKMRKMFRSSLLFCMMALMFWIFLLPVKAGQIEKGIDNQAVEAEWNKEDIQVEDVDGLDEEFAAMEEESVRIVEEVEQYRKKEKRDKIQTAIVIIVTIVILMTGIVAEIQKRKKPEWKQKHLEKENRKE